MSLRILKLIKELIPDSFYIERSSNSEMTGLSKHEWAAVLLLDGGNMNHFEFTPEEREILFQLLQGCLSELHSEISHTDNYEYREMLKKRRTVMQKLSDALEKSEEKPMTA